MAFFDQLLTAFSTASNIKDALGSVLNRCEVGSCIRARNLSVGVACVQCGRFCCNAHGFTPLSAIPLILQTKSVVVVCQDCIVVKAGQEKP